MDSGPAGLRGATAVQAVVQANGRGHGTVLTLLQNLEAESAQGLTKNTITVKLFLAQVKSSLISNFSACYYVQC